MNDSDKNRNEDPRLVLRRSLQTSSSSSSSLSLDDTSPVGAGNSLNHSHDVNYNSAKRPGEKINHELGRKRSKSYSTAEDKEFVDLSPKAPSDSLSRDNSGDRSPPHQTVESSFLMCVVCCKTPRGPPLFGCSQNHLVCGHCRDVGGSLLSCPRCGSSDLSSRQVVAEELLETELKSQVELVSCPYKSLGCNKMTREQMMGEHKEVCVFRPVKCPKGMFSWSCLYIGPLITMQQHARDHHALHHGITVISPGFISSKMFDRSPDRTCCDDKNSAKFQPLELVYGDKLFYCYFERVVDRRLWFFFIRMFGTEDQSKKFEGSIMIGHAGLERLEFSKAGLNYQGRIAHYGMRKESIRDKGYILAVPDEVLKANKVGNVLFRVWFQVKEAT